MGECPRCAVPNHVEATRGPVPGVLGYEQDPNGRGWSIKAVFQAGARLFECPSCSLHWALPGEVSRLQVPFHKWGGELAAPGSLGT